MPWGGIHNLEQYSIDYYIDLDIENLSIVVVVAAAVVAVVVAVVVTVVGAVVGDNN